MSPSESMCDVQERERSRERDRPRKGCKKVQEARGSFVSQRKRKSRSRSRDRKRRERSRSRRSASRQKRSEERPALKAAAYTAWAAARHLLFSEQDGAVAVDDDEGTTAVI